jgi:hypothetical protein
MAGPGPWGSLTRIDSSPHEGQVKTDGSFFLTTLMTLLLRLPNQNPLFVRGDINPAVFQDCRFHDFQHHHCRMGKHHGTEQFLGGNFAG